MKFSWEIEFIMIVQWLDFPIRIPLHRSQHSSFCVPKNNFSPLVTVYYNTLKMCLILACLPKKLTHIS